MSYVLISDMADAPQTCEPKLMLLSKDAEVIHGNRT
jgi:hypothetical protein